MHLGKKKAFIFIAIACVCAGIFFAGKSNNSVKVSYDPNDGSSKTTTKTVYSKQGQTVQELLKSNGYSIDKDLYDYSVSLASQASKIHNIKIVKKANGVITIGDKKVKYSSTQKTIAGLLKEKNIKINKDDIVTPGTSTLLTSKVKSINVVRVTKAQVASTEEVPYQTEVVADSNVSQGNSKVEQSGQNGQKTVVSEAVYHNGVLVSEKVKSSSVTAKPVTMKVSMNPSDIATNTSSKNSTSSASSTDTSNNSSTSSNNSSTASDTSGKSDSSSNSDDTSKSSDTTEENKSSNETTSKDTSQTSKSTATVTDSASSSTSDSTTSTSSTQTTSTTTDSGSTNSNTSSDSSNTSESSNSSTTTKTSTSTVVIPYQTYNVYVSNLAKGTTQTTTQGVNGEKTVTTEMTYEDGKLVSQKEISSTITKQPVTQVVAIGTKEETATTQTTDSTQSTAAPTTSTTSTSSSASSSSNSTQSNLSQYVSQTKNITYNHTTENVSASDFDFLCAVVSQEDNSGYEGALAVISCIMNRADSGKWGGTTAVAVVKAKGQFSAYSSGAYKKYLNGKSSAAVQAAVKDCVYGGVRNHSYYSFQATKKANSVKIGGNYYE
ncbi:G5 domain-containing protein [uncultured Pseudoramibacter sp.]|uniref:G5 domain-containing protein n=1 Tax=uncultured Pseudoramibacter sp. TaxID=1623493 RepID=UPI0025F1E651|nr:G5 domain-containing protein [uncultured Pseudoramibacter sp.]